MGWNIVCSAEIGHWVAQQNSGGYHEAQSQALGLVKDGKIVAGVIYENWNKKSIFCHIAITGRMTAQYLAIIFDYPFNQCGVDKIVVPIVSDNAKSIKLVENMGFSEECRLRDASPTGDIIFYTLLRKNCRFLEGKYHGKISISTRNT